jgi:hypothetical protein
MNPPCPIQGYDRRSILASDRNKDIFNSVRTEPPTPFFARLTHVQNMSTPPTWRSTSADAGTTAQLS